MDDEKFKKVSFVKAIERLRPNSKFSIVEGDISSLDWQDSLQSRPTNDEILKELALLENIFLETKYQIFRKAEYPSFIDYLDGIVKGDQQQIQNYIDECRNIKLKYPKPK